MGGGGDPCVAQFQTVARCPALRLRCKPGAMESAIKEVTGTIPGKHTSSTVSAMCRRCKSENEHTGLRISEGRYRLSPIIFRAKSPAFSDCDVAAVRNQPRASLTGGNLPIHFSEKNIRSAVTIHAMNIPFRLDGRIALVTGGASGIGEQTCRVLAEAGARVIVVDIDRSRAEKLAAELPGGSCRIFDITDEEAVKTGLAGLERLDILINNAGIGLVGTAEETEAEDFDRIFRVNVRGVYLVTKFCLPHLRASHGSIVNIGSVAGLVGVKRRFAYCGTKGAVTAMTKQLAVDYPTEIRVNCIAPGTVDTPFVEGYLEKYHKNEKDKVRQELNQRQPVGRLGKPDEIAYLALYLCSDQAGFVNGSVVSIDGGWTAA
jgi:2-keto-3-deoxy-L-fuconate dehydrogenase